MGWKESNRRGKRGVKRKREGKIWWGKGEEGSERRECEKLNKNKRRKI